VEELPGREALANKEKKPSAKSEAPRIKGVNGRTLQEVPERSKVRAPSASALILLRMESNSDRPVHDKGAQACLSGRAGNHKGVKRRDLNRRPRAKRGGS